MSGWIELPNGDIRAISPPAWERIPSNKLRMLRGMIIDRDEAWRSDPEMAPVIESVIRKGLKNIDEPTWNRLYRFLSDPDLPGSYATYGFDEERMKTAWKAYYKRKGYSRKSVKP